MGIYIEGSIHFSGAGVLIIEDYYMKNGQVEPCIILVKNIASGEYSDFGGSYESKHKSLQKTASTELSEESRNLFNVEPNFIMSNAEKIDMPAFNDSFYRLYVLKINGACRKYFLHNTHLIDDLYKGGAHIPRSWRETNDITHIPIKNIDFDKLGTRGKIVLQDVYGTNINLNGRTKKGIYHAKTIINKMIDQKPVAKRKDIIINKSLDWTNNTYSYILS